MNFTARFGAVHALLTCRMYRDQVFRLNEARACDGSSAARVAVSIDRIQARRVTRTDSAECYPVGSWTWCVSLSVVQTPRFSIAISR